LDPDVRPDPLYLLALMLRPASRVVGAVDVVVVVICVIWAIGPIALVLRWPSEAVDVN
jgi:hypothetical protein